MFRIFSTLTVAIYFLPCMALPAILQIKNDQKKELQFRRKGDVIFKILPGQTSEVVVLNESEYRVNYQPGTAIGKVIWGLDDKLDSLVSKCLAQYKGNNANLPMCRFTFKKDADKSKCPMCYELNLQESVDTNVAQKSFSETLKDHVGTQDTLFPRPQLQNQEQMRAQYDETKNMLAKLKIISGLRELIEAREDRALLKPSGLHNIIVMGDQGAGDAKARQVARDIYAYCSIKGCNEAISTGDNIYPKAPSINTPGWEQFFIKQFTDIYQPLWDRFQMPFYMTLGNHDIGVDGIFDTDWIYFEKYRKSPGSQHYLTERVARMNAQTAYTSHKFNPTLGDKHMWNMESPSYSKVLGANPTNIFIASINSNYFPGEVGPNGEAPEEAKQKSLQKDWLDKSLNAPDAKNAAWRIVFGHHPLFSIGRHGVNSGKLGLGTNDLKDMDQLRKDLLPLLCKYRVDFYLAGHDHHLQLDQVVCGKGEGEGHKIVQILSGAASKKDAESPWGEYLPFSSNAFSAKALYPEFIWGNGLTPNDIKSGIKPKRMLGFAYLSLTEKSAQIEMVESTANGPNLLACYSFNRMAAQGPACNKDEAIFNLFAKGKVINIVPPMLEAE